MTGELFTVRACRGKRPPAGAAAAVRYRDHWFYIDDTDHATKGTLVLMRPTRQLDIGAGAAAAKAGGPVLTLPVGR